jgi:mannosyltransferase OCH1-like enzyme
VILDIAIFAYILIHLIGLDAAARNANPLIYYWVTIDIFIMLLTLPYQMLSKLFMRSGEITKNIFTLYQVQKRKLKERRSHFQKQDEGWKKFFAEEAERAAQRE